jgi:GTP1/Obg family GTP-binding protein
MTISNENLKLIKKGNQLNKIRDLWFEYFGYEKDINERIEHEIDKLYEVKNDRTNI